MLLYPAATSRLRPAAAAAVPLLWAPLPLLHADFRDFVEEGSTSLWLAIHFVQLPLAMLLALAMLELSAPLAGAPVVVLRIAAVAWAVFFAAFDAAGGLATGVLVAGGETEAAIHLHDHWLAGGFSLLGLLAHPTWAVVAVAATLALRRAGGRLLTQAAMLVSLPFALTHVGPAATLALLGLAVALWSGLSGPAVSNRRG